DQRWDQFHVSRRRTIPIPFQRHIQMAACTHFRCRIGVTEKDWAAFKRNAIKFMPITRGQKLCSFRQVCFRRIKASWRTRKKGKKGDCGDSQNGDQECAKLCPLANSKRYISLSSTKTSYDKRQPYHARKGCQHICRKSARRLLQPKGNYMI